MIWASESFSLKSCLLIKDETSVSDKGRAWWPKLEAHPSTKQCRWKLWQANVLDPARSHHYLIGDQMDLLPCFGSLSLWNSIIMQRTSKFYRKRRPKRTVLQSSYCFFFTVSSVPEQAPKKRWPKLAQKNGWPTWSPTTVIIKFNKVTCKKQLTNEANTGEFEVWGFW